MYKNILVAADGSDTSNRALQEAVKLAKEQKAKLRLIHVVDESPAYIALDDAAIVDPGLVATIQKALRDVGQNVLSGCAAVVSKAGIEVDTTMKIAEALVLSARSDHSHKQKDRLAAVLPIHCSSRSGCMRATASRQPAKPDSAVS